MKAYLGTGLLGANFVKSMIKHGEEVNVWNRTAEKAKALEKDGAKAFEDVSEAVKGADVIHLTLKDDATVDQVLKQASKGFNPGVIIIDHTTTSAKGAIKRTHKWKEKGYTYLHAPVFMGPPNALESTGYMLVSGDQKAIKKVSPQLKKMTGKLLNFGSEEGKAASIKLSGNLFLIAMTAGMSDMLAFAKASGLAVKDLDELFGEWNPGAMMPQRLKKISEGNFSKPSWELEMARKDAGLMLKASDDNLVLIPAIAKTMDKWIKKGHGKDDWSVIASDNV